MKKILVILVVILSLVLIGCDKKEDTLDTFEGVQITLTSQILQDLEDANYYYVQRITETEYVLIIDFLYYLFDSTSGNISKLNYDSDSSKLVKIDGENRRFYLIEDKTLNIANFNGNIINHIDFNGDISMNMFGDYLVISEEIESQQTYNIHIYNLELEHVNSYFDYQYWVITDRYRNYLGFASKNGELFEIIDGELVFLVSIADRQISSIWAFDDNHIITTMHDSGGNLLEHTEYYTFNGEELTLFHTGLIYENFDYCNLLSACPYLCVTSYVQDEETYEVTETYTVFDHYGNQKINIDNFHYPNSYYMFYDLYYIVNEQYSEEKSIYDWDKNLYFEYLPDLNAHNSVTAYSTFGQIYISEIYFDEMELVQKEYLYDGHLIELEYGFNQIFKNQPIVYQLSNNDTVYFQSSNTDIREIKDKDINNIDITSLRFEVFSDTIRYMKQDEENSYIVYTLDGDFLYEYKVLLQPTNYLFNNKFVPYNDMKYILVKYKIGGETTIIEVDNDILKYN